MKIAWLYDSPLTIHAFIASMDLRGFSNTVHTHLDTAVEDFMTNQYSLIAMGSEIVPGNYSNKTINDLLLKRDTLVHCQIALHALSMLRSKDSANSKTPTIILGSYDPELSTFFPHVEKEYQKAGATRYVHIHSPRFTFQEFYHDLEALAKKSA